MQVYVCVCVCVPTIACPGTVSSKWTHEVPKATANIHLSSQEWDTHTESERESEARERARGRHSYCALSLSATCVCISDRTNGGCQVQCNHF